MSKLNDFLTELVKGSTHIISSPKTIADLQNKGIKFDTPKYQSFNQLIDDLFQQRKINALNTIKKFPSTPKIAIPTISFLYNEIRECMLFGLNGAAISLSGILVEFALKNAIVKKNCGSVYDKNEWDRIENIELGQTIKEARQLKIIDDETEKALVSFKNKIRNPYLHYNIKKITKNIIAKKVKKVDLNNKKVQKIDLPAEDNPIIWGFAKKFTDREKVFDTFIFVDKIVKYLFEKL